MPEAKAFYSEQARCWFVPVATALISDDELQAGVSPVQVQLRDGTLWITRLPREDDGEVLRRIMAIPTPAGNEYADRVWEAINA